MKVLLPKHRLQIASRMVLLQLTAMVCCNVLGRICETANRQRIGVRDLMLVKDTLTR